MERISEFLVQYFSLKKFFLSKKFSKSLEKKRGKRKGEEEKSEWSCFAISEKGKDCPGMDISALYYTNSHNKIQLNTNTFHVHSWFSINYNRIPTSIKCESFP